MMTTVPREYTSLLLGFVVPAEGISPAAGIASPDVRSGVSSGFAGVTRSSAWVSALIPNRQPTNQWFQRFSEHFREHK
jgi:hypothetical protein